MPEVCPARRERTTATPRKVPTGKVWQHVWLCVCVCVHATDRQTDRQTRQLAVVPAELCNCERSTNSQHSSRSCPGASPCWTLGTLLLCSSLCSPWRNLPPPPPAATAAEVPVGSHMDPGGPNRVSGVSVSPGSGEQAVIIPTALPAQRCVGGGNRGVARVCLQISKLLTEWRQKAALTPQDDVNESIFIVLVNFSTSACLV